MLCNDFKINKNNQVNGPIIGPIVIFDMSTPYVTSIEQNTKITGYF